ncbi:hypothetical protein GA0115251_14531, partial [Streptomyces sp. TverLS-915]
AGARGRGPGGGAACDPALVRKDSYEAGAIR